MVFNFNYLEKEINKINKSDVDFIHIDIMDGEFVDKDTIQLFDMIKINSLSNKKLDVHLMVEKPISKNLAFTKRITKFSLAKKINFKNGV